ncbi:toxin-antitoxin system, antitoxin component, Xre domain protein, partial [Leptospira weilii str. LNT 1234]
MGYDRYIFGTLFVGISKNEKFKEKFQEEKELINLSLELHDLREKKGLSQSELAKLAHVIQQQLSK